MKKTLLFSGLMLASHFLFAQFTSSIPIDIQVPLNYNPNWGLLIQGQTGMYGMLGVEGNATGTIYGVAASVANNMLIGVLNSNATAPSAINIDWQNHVGINTLNTSGYTFNCAGTAVFDQVTVKPFTSTNPKATPWADYVFTPSYHLQPIDSLAAYIKVNNHLPGLPTTADVQQNGIDLAANQAKLLEKIEELTLYTIELQKEVDQLKAKLSSTTH